MAGTNFSDNSIGNGGTIDHFLTNQNDHWILSRGTAANKPSAVAGYAVGGMYQANDTGAIYSNTGSTTSATMTLLESAIGGTATALVDSNGVTALDTGATASAVNNLRATNSATGAVSANAVLLSAVGTDAAISLSVAPKGATGITTIGLATGTGDVVVGSSSATQTVKVGNGAGISTVNLANVSVLGANVNMANAVTGAGVTDIVTIAANNAAATGIKTVNILTGTPGTSGNNRLTMGGGATSAVTTNATQTQYFATNRTSGSAVANAPVATLVNSSGANITVATGLRITLALTAALQAGANTLNLNGAGASAIKKHTNPANDIGVAYVNGSIVDLIFDGTVWQDMSQ